ncbi:MAG: zinc-ribbon domain-containing protein [Pseudomonadota bacterium]|nr:zinc-ribbon domain-containing protein [Pseudomonadota bacterium]
MILSCPQCNANFNLDDAVLGTEGRKVKCSKCGHRWHAIPDIVLEEPSTQPDKDTPPDAQQEEEINDADPFADLADGPNDTNESISGDQTTASDSDEPFSAYAGSQDGLANNFEESAGRQSAKKGIFRIIKGIVLISLIVIILLGISFRADLAKIYPPIERIFELINIPVKPLGYGLKLSNTDSKLRQEGDDSVMAISGEIENTLADTIDLPPLKSEFYDPMGTIIFTHHFKAPLPEILPGEKVKYKTEIKNPPSESVRIEITFTRK